MFYDLFKSLCDAKGVSVSRACLDMGLSRSIAAKWKNTKTNPSAEVLPKIANYFHVSTDYLLGKEDTKKAPAKQEPNDDDIKFALFGGSGEITDEMYEEVKAFAKFVKQREKEKKK